MMREVKVKEMVIAQHPMAAIGGHSGPTVGRVGAAKGLTDMSAPKMGAGQAALKAAADAAKVSGRDIWIVGPPVRGRGLIFESFFPMKPSG